MTLISNERKEWFRTIFDPVASLFVQAGIHPNVLTIAGLVLSVLAGWRFWDGHLRSGALLLLLGGLFDMLDGAVARSSGKGSKFGAFLDSTIDRYAEIIPYLGLTWFLRENALLLLPFLVITGSLMVSYTRARVEGLGGTCTVGLLERPERIALFSAGLLLGGVFLTIALLLLAVGSHWTAIQRMKHARTVL